MKLIDLLVQELPRHGGWPVTVGIIEMHDDGDIFFDGDRAPESFKLPKCDDGWRRGLHSSYNNEVSQEQYEAALSASQQPAWNGKGLPPVGTECELFECEEWHQVKIKYVGDKVVVVDDLCNPVYGERVFHIAMRPEKFRPIRSAEERRREEAVAKMFYVLPCDLVPGKDIREAIYDAIAAGKIPGVKLDDL